jgi:hypothetical protein
VHKEFADAREFGELARAHLTEKIGLNQALTGRGNYSTWIVFANKYLGWNPPQQGHVHQGGLTPIGFNFGGATTEEKRARLDELLAKREGRTKPGQAIDLSVEEKTE